tara:strand:+ start:927 stop:1232 length:306 start_codon:yes stop_codon:yes gene_type:complete
MKLDHVAIVVKDIPRAIEWYCTNLDAATVYCDDTWAMLKVGDLSLALVTSSEHPAHIAFRVSSVEALTGGTVKTHRDDSKYIYKSDSEGNIIELICWEKSE